MDRLDMTTARAPAHQSVAHSVAPLVEGLQAQGIHSVLAQFTDVHGVAKGKLVPIGRLDEWTRVGAGFAGPSIWGTGLPRFGPRGEYYGRVQAESLVALPFMPGVAHAVCDGYAGGEPLETCPRQVLRRQVERLAQRGLTLWVGAEPEFFLLSRDERGAWGAADPHDRLAKPSYDLKSIHRNQAFLEEMRATLTSLGFDVLQIDHEDANSQYEVNYRFTDALQAADRYMLFKLAAHAVAQRHGAVFSCMPKPMSDAPGSGLHFHLSLTDASGNFVMADPRGALGLSGVGHQFAAGLLRHADALAALCAPTVNSYRRLASSYSQSGTTWSPVWKTIGENNRTCLVRTVDGRIEWRLPDPSCNIYLALSATLAAGLDGIDSNLDPVPGEAVDWYQQQSLGAAMPQRLPRDLASALDALEADQRLREAVGLAVCDEFLAIKRAEWDEFSRHVSAWELDRYAQAF